MTRKEILQRLHHKSSRTLFESVISVALFFGLLAITLLAWENGYWPVVIIGWLLQAHVGHTNLLAFHEASHYTLHPSRRLNELQGILLGSVILTPLSAYRWVHNQHHIHLGTPRDPELWPFVDPQATRWRRLLAAAAELLIGFFYTPIIFLRGVLVAQRMPRATVRRLKMEYNICFALWAAVLSAVIAFGVEKEFIVGYLIPAMLAGNLQSLRKFTEHLGLLGHDVPSTTRTVDRCQPAGRLLSCVDAAHRLARAAPFTCENSPLPPAGGDTNCVRAGAFDPISANIFPSYMAAILDMVWRLPDPRVGAQWLADAETAVLPANSRTSASHSATTSIPGRLSEEGTETSRPRIDEAAHAASAN